MGEGDERMKCGTGAAKDTRREMRGWGTGTDEGVDGDKMRHMIVR